MKTTEAVAVRTDCITYDKRAVVVTLERMDDFIHVTQGMVTGYESLQITDESIADGIEHGWTACVMVPQENDGLYIPPDEFVRAAVVLNERKEVTL